MWRVSVGRSFTSRLVYRGVRVRFDFLLLPIPEMLPKKSKTQVCCGDFFEMWLQDGRSCFPFFYAHLLMWTRGERSRLGVSGLPRLTWRVKGTNLCCRRWCSLWEVGHVYSVLLPFPFAFRLVRDDWHKLRQSYSSVFGIEYVAAFARNKAKNKTNFDWMQPTNSVDVKAPLTALTDDINNHRLDPEQCCGENSWVQGFTRMFLDRLNVLAISKNRFLYAWNTFFWHLL